MLWSASTTHPLGQIARWALFIGIVAIGVATRPWLPGWAFMWLVSVALFLGFKVLAWPRGWGLREWPGLFVWFCLWPSMDPGPLLHPQPRPPMPRGEWAVALAKTLFGAALLWGVARRMEPPLLAGWVGMAGLITIFHFGFFHLAALAWRWAGVRVEPLMRNPLAAVTLGEFWGSRWNRGFSDVARRRVFRPLAPMIGLPAATMAVFLFSGVVHELAITVPSRGAYGQPTAYFLFQGAAALWQRAHPRWATGWRGRLFTLTAAAAPAYWLFPPVWVERCILPFFQVIHAL